MHESPATMSCPIDDEAQCNVALSEYITAAELTAIGKSSKLAAYVSTLRK
jgi:hypothetical protein